MRAARASVTPAGRGASATCPRTSARTRPAPATANVSAASVCARRASPAPAAT